MSDIFTASDKILSVNGQIDIKNKLKHSVFTAKGKFFSVTSPWVLYNDQNIEIAKIKKKIFTFNKSWIISGELGNFRIRKIFWSWNRKYLVEGGKFNGAKIIGDFFDFNGSVIYKEKTIISSEEHLFTMRNTHSLYVFGDSYKEYIFAALMIIILKTDKKDEVEEYDDD